MQWGGSHVVPIPYDIREEELLPLLNQLNGVFFTGGALNLVDRVTGEQHQYYKTAKKIFEYAKRAKDESNEHFPLLGIC
jgi:hypothetical protein